VTLRKGESPRFYGIAPTSTLRFVRTSCPTKALCSFLLAHRLTKGKLEKEPTSGLEPLTCSLRVRQYALQGLARGCKTLISRQLSLLRVAGRCTVLRSRWCQSGVNFALAAVACDFSRSPWFFDSSRPLRPTPTRARSRRPGCPRTCRRRARFRPTPSALSLLCPSSALLPVPTQVKSPRGGGPPARPATL
jgi:hypothetical protein